MSEVRLLELAKEVCTPKQLEAIRLAERGLSERAIAKALGNISRSAVRSRLDEGYRKVENAKRQAA